MQDTVQVGRDAREDLVVELTSSSGSTTEIQLHSTVATFFGARIQQVVRQTLEQLGLEGVQVVVRDQGALDWVIQARVEAAAHLLRPQQTAQRAVLPPMLEGADRPVARDRMRRSRLYLPGDQPDLMINAALFEPDAVILDLEDAVAPPQKFAARYLVRNALRAVDFGPAERIKLKARLSNELATYLSETPISEDQRVDYRDDGYQLSATVHDTWQLHFWILSQGAGIEVLRPSTLRASIAEQLRNASRQYV